MERQQQPSWMREAWRELGQRERSGRAANPRIVALYHDAGRGDVASDEVAWCAAFVGACLARAGLAATGSLMARSYLGWGEAIADAEPGAIAVFSRGRNPALGHVGFVVGASNDQVVVLGGNQSDAVTVTAFPRTRLIGLRWPEAGGAIADSGPKPDAQDRREPRADFEAALTHILEMEGGFTDDPQDPGGATNFGITLATYASWIGAAATGGGVGALKAALRSIAPETVRAIYLSRYWRVAGCENFAPALALMHFDAAVNQGPGTAVRILQEVVGTDIDGEIGPATRAAVAAMPVEMILAGYAEVRRRRYRRLAHFPRFGRGWLRRVESTLAAARALIKARGGPMLAPSIPTPQEGDFDMTTEDSAPATGGKWWGQSVTIWGTIVTMLAAVLPTLGPAIGLDVTRELVEQAGSQVAAVVQGLIALAGTVMTIYGRMRASQPLERRPVQLRL